MAKKDLKIIFSMLYYFFDQVLNQNKKANFKSQSNWISQGILTPFWDRNPGSPPPFIFLKWQKLAKGLIRLKLKIAPNGLL